MLVEQSRRSSIWFLTISHLFSISRNHVCFCKSELARDSGCDRRIVRDRMGLVRSVVRKSVGCGSRQDDGRHSTFADTVHYHVFHYCNHMHCHGCSAGHVADHDVVGRCDSRFRHGDCVYHSFVRFRWCLLRMVLVSRGHPKRIPNALLRDHGSHSRSLVATQPLLSKSLGHGEADGRGFR